MFPAPVRGMVVSKPTIPGVGREEARVGAKSYTVSGLMH